MAEDYLELFVKLTPGGDASNVEAWLAKHRLTCRRMKTGLLASGDGQTVADTFAVPMDRLKGPTALPVPGELKEHVASITVPGPRSYHG